MKNYNIAVLSTTGHDASVTLLLNGEIYEILLEERLSGIKKDNHLFHVYEHISKFDDQYGIDKIYLINGTDAEFDEIREGLKKYKLDIEIEEEIWQHHLYHASSGFYQSGFEESACIVIDGWGADYRISALLDMAGIELTEDEIEEAQSWSNTMFLESTSIYYASYPSDFELLWKNLIIPAPQPRGFGEEPFPYEFFSMLSKSDKISVNSCYDIGIMYGTLTRHLGFEDNEQCGKTMGLAAYGNYNDTFPSLNLHNGLADMNVFYSNKILNTTNFPNLEHYGDFQKRADLAWSIQSCMEYALKLRVKQVLEMKPDTKNIVFSGGCALNICANSVIQEEFPDINFFVDPIAGDACQSFGAAKYFHHQDTKSMKIDPMKSIYHGKRQPNLTLLKNQIELSVAKFNHLDYN